MAVESCSGVTGPAYRRGRARLTSRPTAGARPVSAWGGAGCRVLSTRAPVAQGIERRPPEAEA